VVEVFLTEKPFSGIPNVLAATLEAHQVQTADCLESIMEADAWARDARRQVAN
jgi:1-deoxy-D-xylulose 5-phosphate reductoisomerase